MTAARTSRTARPPSSGPDPEPPAAPSRDASGGVDGRTARRDRNRTAVLDAVLELFAEDDLAPSPEQVARRSGVSLRSVYRYVSDGDDLLRAAIERQLAKVLPLFAIPNLGVGPFEERLEAFVTARLRGYEAIAATARAALVCAASNDLIREGLETRRRLLREQVEEHFAEEIEAAGTRGRAVLAAADALTQIEAIEHYRTHRRYSSAETHDLLRVALAALLDRKH